VGGIIQESRAALSRYTRAASSESAAEDLKGLNMDFSGAKYVCSPPPRDRASQEAIWRGLISGVFQTFSSDHCPFRFEDEAHKSHPKGRTSFRWVPNGIPGVAARLPILFSEGVKKGRISVSEFVALTATNHAKMYGLYPRKGSIMVGADATSPSGIRTRPSPSPRI
jgi:dihydropyrimidinase